MSINADNDEILKNNVYFGYSNTFEAINAGEGDIVAPQMALLSTTLFGKEYRIFIKENNEPICEIVLGDNERISRKITMTHHLFNLWMAGEFNKYREEDVNGEKENK